MTSSRRLLRPALVVLVPTVFLFGCYTEACKAYLSAVVHAPHKGFVDNVKMVRDQDGLPWVADRVVAFNETAGFYVEGAPPTFEHFLQCFYYYAIGSIVAPSRVDVEDFLDAVYYDDLGLFMLLSRIRVLSVRESDGKVDVFQGLDTTKGVNQILFPLAHKTCVGFNAYGAGNGIFCADPLERVFRPTLQLQNGVDSWVVREFSLGPKHLIALRGKAPVFTSDDGATFLQKGEGLPQFFQANDVYLSQDHAFLATNAGLYCRPLASYASGAWEKKTALPPGEVTAVAGNLWTPPNKRAWSRPLVASPFLLASLVLNGRAQTWRSDNGGMAWRLDSAGLDAARVYGMVIKPDGTAYAGTNAGMFRYTNGTWVDCSYGMGASTINSFASDVPFAAAHPGTLAATPTLFAATPGNGSGVYRSTDGGQTFAPSDSTMDHVIVNGIASSNGVVIAASSGSVARSTNGGVTWATPAASGLPASGLFLKAIAASNGVVLLSNLGAGSSFYRSTNDGVTWTGTSVPSALGYAIVPAAGAFFVGGNNAIYKSTDGGLSFATIHGITSKPFYSVVSIAVSASAVYAGTYDSSGGGGVSKSTDGGASWKDASAGLPGSAVFALLASGGTV
ncbi:MAG TPA: sialidase family protein, partial [Thermoanaerobaculia bacterium]|nr:sialidase family protein [Thermoanaerobaculia bacterium]